MGTILTDPVTAGSSLEGVFVAGDAASGPKTVIEAVAGGHGAAAAVHAFLAGGSWHAGGRPACEPGPPAYEPAPAGRRPSAAGTRPLEGPAQALAQARRCARCGTCLDCETCHPDCPTRVLVLARPGAEPPLADAGHVKLDASTDPVAGVSLPDRPREVFGVVDPAARVDPRRCLGCGACADACPYEVVRLAFGADGMGVAVIDERACRACGCCVAACPVGAVEQPFWTDRAISTALARPGEDVTMRCRWARDGDRRAVPLPCAGRASVDLVMAALAAGACSVTLLGCGDVCRYRDAERRAGAVTRSARALLDAVGLGAERLARDVPDAGPPPPFIPREQRIEDFPHDRPHARVLGRIETVLSHPEVVARTGNGPLASLAGVRGDTLLATGCQQLLHPLVEEDLGDVLIRDVLHAADLIRRAGARAMLLADERSCGHALEEAGDAAGAARLARLNAESILASGAATVVTTCGRAAGALHAGPLGRSGVPVRHLTSWLVDRGLEPVRAPRPRHVALLVDPADPEVRAAARALLRAAGHRVVLARSARSRPRGRGGVAELLRAAAETGADVVTCTSSPLALDLAYALRPGAWDPVGLEMVPLSTLLAGGGS
jgi:ferredoxin